MKKLIPSIHDIRNSFEKVADQLKDIDDEKILLDIKEKSQKYAQQAQEAFKSPEQTVQKIKEAVEEKKKSSTEKNKKDSVHNSPSEERLEELMTYLRGGYNVKTGTYTR